MNRLLTLRNKCRLLLSSLLTAGVFVAAQAQTTLINPAGDGGFETGATFAANGWTVANNVGTTNNWVVGTGATPGFSGNNAAYITANSGATTPTHTYSNLTPSVVHLYRDITFPAGETVVTLSFSMIQNGELDWDRMFVSMSDAAPTGTPAVGAPVTNSTTITGYTLLRITPQSAGWTNITISIPASQIGNATAATTRRLLFTWQNDDNTGGDPPIGIDNISLISSCVPAASGLAVSSITNTGATLNWNAVTGATGYNVRYKRVTDPVTVPTWATPTNTLTNTLTIASLTPNTQYEFQVSTTGVSCNAFTTSTTFTTLCNAITAIPYLESFGTGLPSCWTATEGTTGATVHWESVTADATHGAAAPRAGTNFMRLDVSGAATANNPYYLTSAPVAIPATGTMNLRYYYYLGSNGYRGRTGATGNDPYPLTVQISANGGGSWTTVFSHDTSNTVFAASNSVANWMQNNVSLSAYAGQTILVRFRSVSNNGTGTWTNQGIDEVSIGAPCTPPSLLSTIPASRCGLGSINLGVTTANTNIQGRWYATATGGIPLFTGNTFTIPNLTGTTTYYVTAVDTTTDCMSATRTAVTATFNPPPAITAASPQSPGVCTNGTATLTASSSNTGYTYTWSTGQTGASITVTVASPTTYIVTGVDPVSTCSAMDSVRLITSTPPLAPTLTPATATICLNSFQQIIANNGGGLFTGTIGTGTITNTINTYPTPYGNWYGGSHDQYMIRASELTAAGLSAGNLTSIAFNLASGYTYAALKDYTVKLAATTQNTMPSSFISSGFSTVYTNTAYTPPSTAGWAQLNFSTPFFWDGTSNIVVDVSFLQCTTCNGTSSCSTTFSNNGVVFQSNPGFNCTYGVYADDNCTVPSFSPSGSPNVVSATNQRPNMRFTTPLPSNPIAWTTVTGLYKDAGLTQPLAANDTNKTVYASPAATTTYTAVSRVNGCSSTPSNTSVITVNPIPTAVITAGGPTTFCRGGSVVLTTPTGTGYTYVWKRGIQVISGATSNTYTADSTGSYTVTTTNSSSCSITSAPVVVIVNPLPSAVITNTTSTTFCNGDSVVLSAPAAPTGSTYTYVWRDNNNPVPGQTARTFTVNTARSVTVTVTNTATGCSATTAAPTITTIASPAAPISSATGINAICAGQSLRLRTNNNLGLGYRWYRNDTLITTNGTDSFYNATLAATYKVVVYTLGNTACSTTSSPLTLTVNPLPVATTTAGGPTSFCIGGSVTLNANTGTGITYQWLQGGNPAPGTNTGATYTATASGSYTVVVTNTATGCSNTSTPAISVTARPLPAPTVSASPSLSICQGQRTVLTSSVTAGTTTGYVWLFNGNPTSINVKTDTVNTPGNYAVTVTDANGCVGTSPVVSVIVNPLPPTAIAPSTTQNICNGSAVFFNGPRISGLTYQWRVGNANASGTSTSATYTATVAGNYRLVVTNTASGCIDSSAAVTVNIYPATPAAMTPTAATTACDTVKLRSTSSGVTYQWNYNGAPIVGATDNNYFARVSGNYSLTTTSIANGCPATTSNVAITINQSPAAIITYSSPIQFCVGGAVTLNTASGSNLTYQWSQASLPLNGATTNRYIATTSGSYTVRVVNTTTGCSRISQPVNVLVNPLPSPVIVATNDTVLTTTTPFASYQWSINSQPIAGANQRTFIAHQNGAYTVAVTDTIGCTNVSSVLFVNSLGITGGPVSASIRVFPNPTTSILHVSAPIAVNLVLRDVAGRVVMKATDSKTLDLSRVADGMYLLYVTTTDGQLVKAEKITKATGN